jgi:hypothetical protein
LPLRQVSQPTSTEDIAKAVGNYFNASMEPRLPSIAKQVNGSAKALIQ